MRLKWQDFSMLKKIGFIVKNRWVFFGEKPEIFEIVKGGKFSVECV